ncbi:MAG: rRNA maturation RNase YbeY [Granulosicoccus sp.]
MKPIVTDSVSLDLQVLLDAGDELAVDDHWLDVVVYRHWAIAALSACLDNPEIMRGAGINPGQAMMELSVQLLSEPAMADLNQRFKGTRKSTNVLSFPADMPILDPLTGVDSIADSAAVALPVQSLGDLVLCPAVIAREAARQGKELPDHRAHLVVHGVLHLCGHDHLEPKAASIMELTEIRILSNAGISDPYQES